MSYKYHVTVKDVLQRYYGNVYSTPNLRNLLDLDRPEAYTCGIYGLNADIYGFGDWALAIGPRTRGLGLVLPQSIRKKYEELSDKVYNLEIYTEKKHEMCRDLLEQMRREITLYYYAKFNHKNKAWIKKTLKNINDGKADISMFRFWQKYPQD